MKPAIFLALDFPTWSQTKTFITNNELEGVPVKVGMELFYKEGPKVIEHLKANGHPIFLDLKLHDIPTTVKKAMSNLAKLGVDIVNIHAFGGGAMIQAAKEGLLQGSNQGNPPKLIAVTLLTSVGEDVLHKEINIDETIDSTVKHLAQLTKDNGGDGVVCSANEVAAIKHHCGTEFMTVTPGIRLSNTKKNDQQRVATPEFARNEGADAIVIGRTITDAQTPNKVYQQVEEEWFNVIRS